MYWDSEMYVLILFTDVVEHNLDLLTLSETWLDSKISEYQIFGDLIPSGFSFPRAPRETMTWWFRFVV